VLPAGLYAILDLPHPHGLDPGELAAAVIAEGEGAAIVQVRAKRWGTAERVAALRAIAPLCARFGVPLIVNDDVEAALEGVAGVSGVHFGQEDLGGEPAARGGLLIEVRARARECGLPGFVIGLSTHSAAQVQAAQGLAVDYLGYGPVFATRSKERPEPEVGLEGLGVAARLADVPVVAIGGLDGPRGVEAIAAGARAVAVIGALVAPTIAATRERALVLSRMFVGAGAPRDMLE